MSLGSDLDSFGVNSHSRQTPHNASEHKAKDSAGLAVIKKRNALDISEINDLYRDMFTELPPFEVISRAVMARIDEIKEIRRPLPDVRIEAECKICRGTIYRIKRGEGSNYETVQSLYNWTVRVSAEIEAAGVVFSTSLAAVPSIEVVD